MALDSVKFVNFNNGDKGLSSEQKKKFLHQFDSEYYEGLRKLFYGESGQQLSVKGTACLAAIPDHLKLRTEQLEGSPASTGDDPCPAADLAPQTARRIKELEAEIRSSRQRLRD